MILLMAIVFFVTFGLLMTACSTCEKKCETAIDNKDICESVCKEGT